MVVKGLDFFQGVTVKAGRMAGRVGKFMEKCQVVGGRAVEFGKLGHGYMVHRRRIISAVGTMEERGTRVGEVSGYKGIGSHIAGRIGRRCRCMRFRQVVFQVLELGIVPYQIVTQHGNCPETFCFCFGFGLCKQPEDYQCGFLSGADASIVGGDLLERCPIWGGETGKAAKQGVYAGVFTVRKEVLVFEAGYFPWPVPWHGARGKGGQDFRGDKIGYFG